MYTEQINAIDSATDLNELCSALNALEGAIRETNWNDPEARDKLEDFVDVCGLDDFGGESPDDPTNVWSWDEDSVLTYTSAGADKPWCIESRQDW